MSGGKGPSMHQSSASVDYHTQVHGNNASMTNVSLNENQVEHLHVCGGLGRCSTCRVQILDGLENCSERSQKEQVIADKLDFPDDVRLACQTLLSGDAKIRKLFKNQADIKFAQAAMQSSGSIGSNKQVAILFADIEDFTPLSERLASFDVMYLLNKYFDFIGNSYFLRSILILLLIFIII